MSVFPRVSPALAQRAATAVSFCSISIRSPQPPSPAFSTRMASRSPPTEPAKRLRYTSPAPCTLYPVRMNPDAMLAVAISEARLGRAEGGIPIGAAIFTRDGALLGSGHNRRVQHNDPSAHGETDAFRNAGRQRSYRDLIMVTTLAPCWYCTGLIRQFHIGTLVVGESRTFAGGLDWLRENGVEVIDLDSQECRKLMEGYIAAH